MSRSFILLCIVLIRSTTLCNSIRDIPFYDEICSEELPDRKVQLMNEINRIPRSFDKTLDSVFYPDIPIPLPFLKPFSGANELGVQYMNSRDASDLLFHSPLRLRKRSVAESEESLKNGGNGEDQYDVRFLTPLLREIRDKEGIKTIQIPPSFTPRLGRKRSEEFESVNEDSNYKMKDISGRSRIVDLHAGNAFTPRLGRSEETNKVNLFAGNAFTPRLGRSEEANKVHLFAGNAFTPRLGRSEDMQKILFRAGNAFTPRLERFNHLNKLISNTRTNFTPRSERSESRNRIQINAGSAFTPRVGKADGSKMFFNAGNSFTPRLGRSEDRSKILLNAGNAFTPRLG